MKHRKTWMALLLCAALLLSGCAGKQEDAKEETSQKVLNFGCQMYDDRVRQHGYGHQFLLELYALWHQ